MHWKRLILFRLTIAVIFTTILPHGVLAQDCDDNVPHFDVDLSGAPNDVFFSPAVQREGNCCGTSHPDRCISFSITLHEDAVGIIFDICEGAVPPGALFYQIDCGPPVAVGNILCLNGAGPHHLTFCKPGNNTNVYCITSVPAPAVGPPQVASDGCIADIYVMGLEPSTIQWTSVVPDAPGTYNNLLSCTQCENPTVTAPDVFPPFVDFMVCGQTIGGCAVTPHCDTVRVYFEQSLEVGIAPEDPVICFGSLGTDVTAVGNGGFPPYTFTWSTGDTGETVWIEEPGTYTVTVTDTSDCPPASYTFVVGSYELPITVDAGENLVVCEDIEFTQLNVAISGTDNGMWSGGSGDFIPSDSDPNAQYIPHEDEVLAGQVTLTYTLFPDGGCPGGADSLTIYFATFSAEVVANITNVSCFGTNDGSISLDIDGNWPPYTVEWMNQNMSGTEILNLAPGTYQALITIVLGCTETFEYTISTPELLELAPGEVQDVTCFGASDGTASVVASGGTEPYTFVWTGLTATGNAVQNLQGGVYNVTVTDANGCESEISIEIEEPELLWVTLTGDTLVCPDADMQVVATAGGGTGNINYHWSHGLPNTSSVTTTIQEPTVFSVFVSDENGCLSGVTTFSVDVVLMDAGLLSAQASSPVCLGGSISLNADYPGPHPPYTYSWSHGLPSTAGPHEVQPDETTTYSVEVSDYCGNSVTTDLVAVVWPLPSASLLDQNDVSCHGMNNGTATTSVTGGSPGYFYQWSDGVNHGEQATNLAPGHYSVLITDIHQCPDSLEFFIDEPEPLMLTASSDTLVCPGDSFNISATATGGIEPYFYSWSHNFGDAPSHSVQLQESAVITVSVTDSSGCETPVVELAVTVINFLPELLQITPNQAVCEGESTSLSAHYNGNHPPYDYNWSGLPSGPGPHVVSPSSTTIYSLEVTDICNNVLIASTEVVVHPLPVAMLPPLIEEGCAPLHVIYQDPHNNPETHSYLWTIDETLGVGGHPFDYTFPSAGVYSVSVQITSVHGCQSEGDASGLVIVRPTPVASFSANPWEAGIDEPEIQFFDQSQGTITSRVWSFGDGETSIEQHPLHQYADTGHYSVKLVVENAHGCTDSLVRSVRIKPVYEIIIPNAFTPGSGGNGYYDPADISNDIFYPFADYVEHFRMSIFNRWGELIFESKDIRFGWNGTYRGEPCPQDVYVYKIEFTFSDGENITRVGDITLFR